MIFVHVRHGRTARDASRLANHLLRLNENQAVEVVSRVGLGAVDVAGMLAAMRRLAPKATSPALHHVSISPAGERTVAELRADADRLLQEVGVNPETHPHCLVVHRKTSANRRGSMHAHVVFAHWNLDGAPVRDGWIRLRLERLAREIEFDGGEQLTRGRHDVALSKALVAGGRGDVAGALDALATPEAPRSATTAARRQKLKREGVSDTDARAAVKAAWAACDGWEAFKTTLGGSGLSVAPGAKRGVLLVVTADGVEIGALDRILRVPRGDVARLMDGQDDTAKPPVGDRPRVGFPNPNHRQHDNEIAPAPPAAGRNRGAESAGGFAGNADSAAARAAPGDGAPGENRAVPTLIETNERATRRRKRIQGIAAARALATSIDATELQAEVARRAAAARAADLCRYIARGEAYMAQCRRVPPISPALADALARRDEAEAKAAAERARTGKLQIAAERIAAREPKGLTRVIAWASGALRRHKAFLVAAREAAEDQRRGQGCMEYIAEGAAALAEREREKAAMEAERDAVQRRQAHEDARERVMCAQAAIAMLANNNSLASQPISVLLRLAWTERRQADAQKRGQAETTSYAAPAPRMP